MAPASAQIVTDGTLGAASTLSGANVTIPASLGRQAGANLFHSFATFNVSTGGSAMFSGPVSVGNVLARVTGGTASSINGKLGTSIAGANLYLINP
ncbi:MAG: filamentous hemagglutinin N-terminal domain-containing protein, partial [Rhodocyclaceae bacterium]|nr:filamentous hemagglutinin N-terminal domain-containing protein [Rhodocyclaceae bacterium]